MYIQTRHNADLFNVSHFKGKTKTERILVQEMLFADDSTIVAPTAEGTQALVDRFERAARSFGLKINIKKTECLYHLRSFTFTKNFFAVLNISVSYIFYDRGFFRIFFRQPEIFFTQKMYFS